MKKSVTAKKVAKKGAKKTAQHTAPVLPLADRVLIQPTPREEVTASGIIIPDTVSKEKPEQGKVIAVGEGKYEDGKLIPPRVSVGDVVVFSKYGYDEIKVDGVEYFILREDSILAIINK